MKLLELFEALDQEHPLTWYEEKLTKFEEWLSRPDSKKEPGMRAAVERKKELFSKKVRLLKKNDDFQIQFVSTAPSISHTIKFWGWAIKLDRIYIFEGEKGQKARHRWKEIPDKINVETTYNSPIHIGMVKRTQDDFSKGNYTDISTGSRDQVILWHQYIRGLLNEKIKQDA